MTKTFFHAVVVLCLVAVFFIAGCQPDCSSGKNRFNPEAQAMVVSVSTDGRYVLSSNQDQTLVLWDLHKKSKTAISSQTNIYSAYFIKETDKFLWQDLNDTVHVQDTAGKTIKTFSHFPTYGHVMSQDLNVYFSSDQNWNIFSGYEQTLQPVKKDAEIAYFLGAGKLLNLSLSDDETTLLSAGDGSRLADNEPIKKFPPISAGQRFSNYAGVVLWDAESLKPLYKLSGNLVKTTATLSPDGQWVVSGDENTLGYVWDAETGGKKIELASLHHGITITHGSDDYEKWTHDKMGLIPVPKDFKSNEAIIALKFIDQDHFLRFSTGAPYAILYHVDNPLPLKYFPLGREPFPSVSDYSRNAAIDTAPDVGILVTGQRDGGGIIVYKYDAKKRELEKTWTGN